jgi:hypothetical protein
MTLPTSARFFLSLDAVSAFRGAVSVIQGPFIPIDTRSALATDAQPTSRGARTCVISTERLCRWMNEHVQKGCMILVIQLLTGLKQKHAHLCCRNLHAGFCQLPHYSQRSTHQNVHCCVMLSQVHLQPLHCPLQSRICCD